MTKFFVAVPSHRRPESVETIPIKPNVWVVNDKKDKRDYLAAGAESVEVSREPWPGNRNTGIDLALREGAVCVQIDDDLKGVYRVWHAKSQWKHVTEMPILRVAQEVWQYMCIARTPFGGVYPYDNPYWVEQRIHTWGFICGPFMVIDPRLPERFTYQIMEDWEMTCKVLSRVGCVARPDYYIVDHKYDAGLTRQTGGLADYRTPERDLHFAHKLVREYPN
ncbi:MAG: hypothetical protein OXG15_01465, partial [Gammaproteobacteria bacterium]|nr:hypothetical protein [Gammaproteobacteria bacterium]